MCLKKIRAWKERKNDMSKKYKKLKIEYKLKDILAMDKEKCKELEVLLNK